MGRLRIALCQLNAVVGDLEGNVERVLRALAEAEAAEADMAVFPELMLTGYPPEDLLLEHGFVEGNLRALDTVAAKSRRCAAVVGFVEQDRYLYNSAAVCAGGKVHGSWRKQLLPNYAVFDERRYFAPGQGEGALFLIGGVRVGVTICEDAWSPSGPVSDQAARGAELVVSLNASPYRAGVLAERERMLATRAADATCALAYVNLVGGQDELVFDGASMIFGLDGSLLARAPQFEEALLICDIEIQGAYRKRLLDPRGFVEGPPAPVLTVSDAPAYRESQAATATTVPAAAVPVPPVPTASLATDSFPAGAIPLARASALVVPALGPVEEVYAALVTGTHDYVLKNGFSDVVIGLSGGVDSSLVAAVAVDALGAQHVHGVLMPSRYSSEGSLEDARSLAANLGIESRLIPIEAAHVAFLELLEPSFRGLEEGLAEENVQSRVRGTLLMGLSNKLGWLVLLTGNKSEMAVGYSTLYGDMAGGFAVIKDVPKLLVYDLCRMRNARAGSDWIPESVLDKPPSAELRPDQRDDDSLPPYEILDPIIEGYVELDRTVEELVAAGSDEATVRRVIALIDRAEYKRRQTPPGVRVTSRAFGKDRRMPITNLYGPAFRPSRPAS
jgi:NAD+ synthase (glutamine-hydrolysing)